MQHFSDRSKLRNLSHFFCPLIGWLILLSHESPSLYPSFLACSIFLFSSSGGLLFPSHIPSLFTSSCIHLFSPYPSFLLSLTKKKKSTRKSIFQHYCSLLVYSMYTYIYMYIHTHTHTHTVNNFINHVRLRTAGENPTAMLVHPLCKQKWKSLKGWPAKKQKKHMAKITAIS